MIENLSWKEELSLAAEPEDVITLLRLYGLGKVADRLSYLQSLAAEDPDEQPMALHSMRELAYFLMSERQLPGPEIAISPDGLAQIEWRVGETGVLAMEFLPDELIRFAAVSASARSKSPRMRVSGTLQLAATLKAVEVFTAQITSDAWQPAS